MGIEPAEIEKALWDLLDDIDTAFDRFKPRMEEFEAYVDKKVRQRHKWLHTNGYRLFRPK